MKHLEREICEQDYVLCLKCTCSYVALSLIVPQNLLFVWRTEVSLVKVELRSSTAIGGVLYVVTTGGLRKLSWCADSWATPLHYIFIGGWILLSSKVCFAAFARYEWTHKDGLNNDILLL